MLFPQSSPASSLSSRHILREVFLNFLSLVPSPALQSVSPARFPSFVTCPNILLSVHLTLAGVPSCGVRCAAGPHIWHTEQPEFTPSPRRPAGSYRAKLEILRRKLYSQVRQSCQAGHVRPHTCLHRAGSQVGFFGAESMGQGAASHRTPET